MLEDLIKFWSSGSFMSEHISFYKAIREGDLLEEDYLLFGEIRSKLIVPIEGELFEGVEIETEGT